MGQETHVILGAGQIGTLLREQLGAHGVRVLQVRRSGRPAGRPSGAYELRVGDLADPAFAADVMVGARVAYGVINPSYDRWATELPPLLKGVAAGAERTGVPLVLLQNLYMYGQPEGGRPMDESTPVRPCSRKGKLCADLSEELLARSRAGKLELALARASDFFGPHVTAASIFGDRFFQRVLRGRAPECLGDPDQPHSYSYGPDVAKGLITLGEHREAFGRVWHLPASPAESTRALMRRFGVALGRPLEAKGLPDLFLRVAGVVSPVLREVAEMTYQWKSPFVLEDRAFREAFSAHPTPVEDAVEETVRWARGAYAAVAA